MAITTPASTATLAKAVDPAVRKSHDDEYKAVEPKIELLFGEISDQQDWNQEEETYFGLGILPVVTEGANYEVDVPIQGYNTVYTPVKYGTLIQVTDEEMRYEHAAITKATSLARKGAKASARRIGKDSASVFTNGFNTSYTSYGDSKPLFSTSHTSSAGLTAQSNASATGITLTESNLETAIVAFVQQLDDRLQAVDCYPTKLIVPTALQKEAVIITKSEKRSGSGDNDVNVYSMNEYVGGMMNVVHNRYLDSNLGGSDTAWFLTGANNKLTWLWGIRPEVQKRNEFEGYRNDTYFWKVRVEYDFGWSDWRNSYGTKGDTLAFAD